MTVDRRVAYIYTREVIPVTDPEYTSARARADARTLTDAADDMARDLTLAQA